MWKINNSIDITKENMYYKHITIERINITKGEVQNEEKTNDGTFNERDGVNRGVCRS